MVGVALIREYIYSFATVSPKDGVLDWMIAPKSHTLHMNAFLRHVSEKHSQEFVVMILDGAPSHRSQGLEVANNVCLVRLPSYSPELNPA
jgi:transposase-like protein